MRKKIIAGNWKMNKLAGDGARFVMQLRESFPEGADSKVEAVVCAPFIHVSFITEEAREHAIQIGAQNMKYEDSGPFRLEVRPEMIKDVLVDYVTLGHSERGEYFIETDETVNKKEHAAFKH